ncbi:MAG: hypothetical protein GF405_00415 [Candidatus Eisenbacteria bacterium]|nr:hypothetical protein [Candidatus Eisenbacteria bacterium]
MKQFVAIALAVLFIAPAAFAQQTLCYGWEDGGTIMGFYGNLVDDTNVTGPQTGDDSTGGTYTCPGAYEGSHYLHVAEEPIGGTPQAYVAFIEGLTDGDVVTASFYGYDDTPTASPSLRIWGHYAQSGDVNSYAGSASGNYDYTAGTGWDYIEHTWTFDSDGGTRDALVIEARLYSGSGGTRGDYWIDNVCVTAPDGTIITFPAPVSPVEDGTWSNIKALYR